METETLVKELIRIYADKKYTLCFAESCTGGLAAASVVALPGASEIFYGSIVSYDNSVKRRLLGVPRTLLEIYGAVSEKCAMQMAKGAREAMGTDVAVSVTGIAGPGGGSAEKPIGLVYIGVDSVHGTRVTKHLLGEVGDRTAIREHSVREMLSVAIAELDKLTK